MVTQSVAFYELLTLELYQRMVFEKEKTMKIKNIRRNRGMTLLEGAFILGGFCVVFVCIGIAVVLQHHKEVAKRDECYAFRYKWQTIVRQYQERNQLVEGDQINLHQLLEESTMTKSDFICAHDRFSHYQCNTDLTIPEPNVPFVTCTHEYHRDYVPRKGGYLYSYLGW